MKAIHTQANELNNTNILGYVFCPDIISIRLKTLRLALVTLFQENKGYNDLQWRELCREIDIEIFDIVVCRNVSGVLHFECTFTTKGHSAILHMPFFLGLISFSLDLV